MIMETKPGELLALLLSSYLLHFALTAAQHVMPCSNQVMVI